jgi:MATE family multidrug resistance protein
MYTRARRRDTGATVPTDLTLMGEEETPATPRNWRIGEELRALMALALPVVLSELAWMLMSVVDTIMVGRLGPEAIGAVGLSSGLYYVPTLFGAGLLLGLDTLVSQAYGRKDGQDCRLWLTQGLYIALLVSIPSMVLVWLLPGFLPGWKTNPAVAAEAAAYLRSLTWGTPFLLVYVAFRRYLQGVGVVKPITFALISANLVNLAGNWALIYGKLGLPALGVRGSAISTVLARVYMAGFLIFVAVWHERRRGFAFFAHWYAPNWLRIQRILRLGGPAATQMGFEIGAFSAATVLAARLSQQALAAHMIALNCASVTYMVPLGISAAAAVSVGHAIGARDPARAQRAGWLAIAVAGGFMAVMAVLLVLFPHPIVRIYSVDLKVIAIGAPLLGLAAAFQIFDGVQTAATGALRGLGLTTAPMILNMLGYWVFGLPLGYYLCFQKRLGVFGVWIGLTIALILIASLIVMEWKKECSATILSEGGNV